MTLDSRKVIVNTYVSLRVSSIIVYWDLEMGGVTPAQLKGTRPTGEDCIDREDSICCIMDNAC